MRTPATFDAVVVGGGPAGLSAALVLGRCRRTVLLCDSGSYRNDASHALHGYLTREGTPPSVLRAHARRELEPYRTVTVRDVAVVDAAPTAGRVGFTVTLDDGSDVSCRRLLLATGVRDRLPDVDGLADLYGRGVWHCPYCDGWEQRDRPLAAYGQGKRGVALALELTLWTNDLVLCTDGASLPGDAVDRLARNGVGCRTEPVARLRGGPDGLVAVEFVHGRPLARAGLFFATEEVPGSPLAQRLGCTYNEQGTVATTENEATNVPGLYVAGDASKAAQMVVVAAAEGAQAAAGMNTSLLREDLA